MRRGQAGFDPTDNGEPQSIFDAMAMDYGAPFESTAVSRKKIIEENEKGVKEKLIIVGPDGSTTENSLFTPSSVASGMADGLGTAMDLGQSLEAQFGFNPDNDTSKLGQILPISDEGIAAILENESAIDRENDVMNRMDAINANMTPADIGAFLTPPEGSGKLRFDADGAVSRSHNQAREELIFKGGIDGMMDNQLYQGSGVSGSGDLVERGGLQAESIFEQGASEMSPYQREYESSGATHTMPDGTVMPGATHRDNALRGQNLPESIFEQGAASMNYAGDGVATGSGDLAPRGEERAEGLNATDVQVIAQSASGTEALEELDKDIKAANGDDNLIAAAGQEFMDGISDLGEYDPQLVKSLFAMAAAMMMGESFGDAMATGFGVMEEAAMADEAADKAASEEVVQMLIDNAPYLNDENILETLKRYNLSDEETKSILTKIGIAKTAAANKKIETDLATALTDVAAFETLMKTTYKTKENGAVVVPAIDSFLTYASKQLNDQATPSWFLDRENGDAVERAIGMFADRYNKAFADNNYGEMKTIQNGGIEAIWEGQRGTYSLVDGKPMQDVKIPRYQEALMSAMQSMLSVQFQDPNKKNLFLAEKHEFWQKNVAGKTGMPFNQSYKEIEEMGFMDTEKSLEVGYMGWLFNQIKGSI